MIKVILWLTGEWNLQSHNVMQLGSNPLQPIRCCLAKGGRLWVGYWNKIHVVDIDNRKVEVTNRGSTYIVFSLRFRLSLNSTFIFYHYLQQVFPVSERSEQQVRFLCAGGSGVWTSCRLDPVLRLFDWTTGRPLQEVDFTAVVTKTLGSKTFFSCKEMLFEFKLFFTAKIFLCLCRPGLPDTLTSSDLLSHCHFWKTVGGHRRWCHLLYSIVYKWVLCKTLFYTISFILL